MFAQHTTTYRRVLVPELLQRVRQVRWSRRTVVFAVLLALYVALTVAVLVGSPLDQIDRWGRTVPLDRHQPGLRRFVLDYVMLGQRAPSAAAVGLWVLWLCRRRRSLDPLLRFATALFLLNLTVGAVKVLTGRWGPFVTGRAHDVFAGGDIYPSGHVSNAVVVFGLAASLATVHRKAMIALAVWVSLTVGVAAFYLDFHWFTDVVGGWLAGALVLVVLPACVERCTRWAAPVLARCAGLTGRLAGRFTAPMTDPRSAGNSPHDHSAAQ